MGPVTLWGGYLYLRGRGCFRGGKEERARSGVNEIAGGPEEPITSTRRRPVTSAREQKGSHGEGFSEGIFLGLGGKWKKSTN
ncbi:hypothetical protein KQX54_005691 [Cotesia glomerata]|uniref:Uncharacterized protein n=1 Tax=Cotesia glomerata TaxID=32391 RepID=A0AAV7IYR1_COTGL|nr:hypothetical protein KQX54_005691 [Cotesia glomerata]